MQPIDRFLLSICANIQAQIKQNTSITSILFFFVKILPALTPWFKFSFGWPIWSESVSVSALQFSYFIHKYVPLNIRFLFWFLSLCLAGVCMRMQILCFLLQFRSNGILDLVNGIACNIIRISCEFDVFAHICAFSVFFHLIAEFFLLALLLYYSLIIYPFWSRQNEIQKKTNNNCTMQTFLCFFNALITRKYTDLRHVKMCRFCCVHLVDGNQKLDH